MKISTRQRYGLRAMIELANNQGHARLGDIANKQEISRKYLDAIFIALKTAGLVRGRRGVGGGQWLLREPQEIRVGDIYRAIGGNMAVVDCVGRAEVCDRAESCVARKVWQRLNQAIQQTLDEITLADLMEQESEVRSDKKRAAR